MKKKRLNRDGWGFQYFPYYQMRIDCDRFHGLVCLLRIVEGDSNYWEMPKAGRVAVCGEGMTWLQMIPDEGKRVITVKYFHDGDVDTTRTNYPSWASEEMCPSLWYVDVMEKLEYDEQGIAVYVDKYLDVIFSPEGDVKVDDRDELDEQIEKTFTGVDENIVRTKSGKDLLNRLNVYDDSLICSLVHKFGRRGGEATENDYEKYI